MERKEVKVFENTSGIKIKYDLNSQSILETSDTYKSESFKKYNINKIIYDERMVCCFYTMEDHPFRHMFTESFINFAKLFTHYGLVVIMDGIDQNVATILIYPSDKVKTFKS